MPNACVAANALALPSLTRRGLLVGLASGVVTVPAGIGSAAANAERELATLGATFDQSLAAHEAARHHYNDCENRYFDLSPMPPDELTFDGPLGHLLDSRWSIWSAHELRRLLKDGNLQDSWPAIRAALPLARAYEKADKAAEHASGVIAAEVASDAAIDRLDEVCGLILAAPARGTCGLAVKARAVKRWGKPEWWERGGGDVYERLAAQIIDAVIAAAERSA
jgi:hypothetical protein